MSLRASRFGLVLKTEADVCDSSRQLLGSGLKIPPLFSGGKPGE
jgi:hypothetical protein